MEKTGIITALCAFAVLAGGCDFIRTVAGRPTSEYIDAKRVLVEQQELRKQQVADSIALAKRMEEEAKAHALAAEAVLQRLNGTNRLIPATKIANLDKAGLEYAYYLMIGSFSSQENAQSLVSKAQEAGFDALILPYRNGRNAVALDPSNDIVKIEESLTKALAQPFCPAEAWILVVE